MKLAGIYVQTPYQLINALNVAINYLDMDGCVLFLKEKYYLTNRLFRIHTKDSFIKGIYYTQNLRHTSWIRSHWIRARGVLTGNSSALYTTLVCYHKSIPVFMPRFDVMICNKYDIQIVETYMGVYNICPKVFVIEDGLADYVHDFKDLYRDYTRIFNWSSFYKRVFNESALQTPKISLQDVILQRVLSNTFYLSESEKKDIDNCKCIYFHQPRDNMETSKEMEYEITNLEKNMVTLLQQKYGEGFFVKLHPRDDLSLFPNIKKLNSEIPWEFLLTFIRDASSIILVGLHSTALVTPKLLFNIEPKVIVLEKIWRYWTEANEKNEVERVDLFFREFKQLYTDSSKVIIPSTEKELMNSFELN